MQQNVATTNDRSIATHEQNNFKSLEFFFFFTIKENKVGIKSKYV